MLTKEEKRTLRSDLFRYLDGVGIAPTAYILHKSGLLETLLEQKEVDLSTLSNTFKANEGYLNVALRLLVSQGWLDYLVDNEKNTIQYSINNKSKFAFNHFYLYEGVYELLQLSGKFHKRLFNETPFVKWNEIVHEFKHDFGLTLSEDPLENQIQKQILKHIEGALVAPTIVALGMSGMFHKYFMEHSFHPGEFHQNTDSFIKLLDFFGYLGWFDKKRDTYSFTEKGFFFAKRATAFGVTVSYNPNFRILKELIFGNPTVLRDLPEGAPEKHVDRVMNVWGSGGAHSSYFNKVDEIIINLFNKPIHEQPKGIVDMGCGNGAYLQHLFEVIAYRTQRGKMLDEYPLVLVGADYNMEALKVTRANLIKADIWAKVIWGDIGRPDLLAQKLQEDYNIQLNDLLNVRTFLDHNRPWFQPLTKPSISLNSNSTGAFAHQGVRLNNNLVELNLLEHFKKWSPYVERFGLLVIELHTVDPVLVAKNIGKTAATAYDATHGFSDQYIVEVPVFHKIAKMAGLILDLEHYYKFPNNDLATVTINLFKKKKT